MVALTDQALLSPKALKARIEEIMQLEQLLSQQGDKSI